MLKFKFTKKQFEVKPAGKSETASWENFISLLEKYFFSVEKLFFSNWALSGPLSDAFLFLFARILPPFCSFSPHKVIVS